MACRASKRAAELTRPLLCLAFLLLGACREAERAPEAAFVGRDACTGCHADVALRWRGSHHDRAMQVATPATVRGDFADATFEHFGVTSRFSRLGEQFIVHTDGADGTLRDFEVAYTLGVEPLQQYLVRFPDGRVQALPFAWDTRPESQGGQRWFHLYPDEPVPHGDLLHWTGIQQNWNHMCAACHSTNVDKGYRSDTNRFDTRWSEIDVSCEACHGPGSEHVRQARDGWDESLGLAVRLGDEGGWRFAADAAIAHRVPALRSREQVETCGRCHARASLLSQDAPEGQPLLDTHRVALLDAGLYFADGQIQDEVYVYGSFLQSRMYAAGVRCSDCHDPHSLQIEGSPDDTCSRCHLPEVFASPAHHHHEAGSAGASCVACHMPARTYMQIDDRRDHGFRVPQPGFAGAPNVCVGCHADQGDAWTAEAGAPARAHFAGALQAGRNRAPGASNALAALASDRSQPAIVRASALRLLGGSLTPEALSAVEAGLGDGDALVRMAAVGATEGVAPARRLTLVRPRLGDRVLAVRLEAERVLRGVPRERMKPVDRAALAQVQGEHLEIQRLHADRPESWTNIGLLEASRGNAERALAAYERALRIEPRFVPAAVNLSDLYRALDRDRDGERVLRASLAAVPESADAHHALGLTLVRLGQRERARAVLARAAELAPDLPRYAFVYAVSLHSSGDSAGARRVLESLLARHPGYAPARDLLARIDAR